MKTKHPKTGIHLIVYNLKKEADNASMIMTRNLYVFYT
jgi:hypothetical protein